MFDSIVQAIKESVGRKVVEIGGNEYLDANAYIPPKPAHEPWETLSLDGLLPAVNSGVVINIVSPRRVEVSCEFDAYGHKLILAVAEAPTASFPFGEFISLESMRIKLLTCFVPTHVTTALLAAIASVQTSSLQTSEDDGIHQSVASKKGVIVTRAQILPIQNLAPYRSFAEIEQVESPFLFRLREGRDGETLAALFDAQGDLWQVEAVRRIRTYLMDTISEGDRPQIIG